MWYYSYPILNQEANKDNSELNSVIKQEIKDLEYTIQANGTQEQINQFKKTIDKAQSKIK